MKELREREREGGQRQRETQTERQRQSQRDTQRDRDRNRDRQTETQRETHTHRERHAEGQRDTDYYYYLPMTTGLVVVGVKAAVYLISQLVGVAEERCGFRTSNCLLTPRGQCPCAVPETDHQQPDGR